MTLKTCRCGTVITTKTAPKLASWGNKKSARGYLGNKQYIVFNCPSCHSSSCLFRKMDRPVSK